MTQLDEQGIAQRDELARLLDDLVQEVSVGTKTKSRKPTYATMSEASFDERYERLRADALAAIRVIKNKNSRAAARAKQMAKRRGLPSIRQTK